MKNKESRSQTYQMFAIIVFLIYFTQTASTHETQEILIRGHSNTNNGAVPKILKLAQNQGIVKEVVGEPLFTLKSDPVRVQSDFQTVDISVVNKQRDRENAKKVAIVQEDLQSRIKLNEPEPTITVQIEGVTEPEADPEEVLKKQAKVKEDIESRVLSDDGILGYRQHFPVKRSDDEYYADEAELPQQPRMTTEAPREEDSFFSIFESLFGTSDDDSQTKKKANPEDKPTFIDQEEENMKENIKTVGNILKPLKAIDKVDSEPQNAYAGYQSNIPEYRIVNNFHTSQTHKQSYKQPESKPTYHNFYRPTEMPFRPYKPYSTSGYEDYDLEEFMDKGESTTKIKYISSIGTTTTEFNTPTTTTTTTTTMRTTPKNGYDNKLKFPSIQKKNDYINRNRYQETKTEPTERITERVTYHKPEIKATTEVHRYSRPNHENKDTEIKTQKIQESPNFYNLINLPVRYSTKDTAIPLISTSYANTKIQGMGAHKYEKGNNGKYPNHKYDQSSSSTAKSPSYWATKRTSTERPSTSFKPSTMVSKTTSKHIPGSDSDKIDYDDVSMGMGVELGSYGTKTSVEVKTQTPVRSTTASHKEITTKKSESKTTTDTSLQTGTSYNQQNTTKQSQRIPEKTSVKPPQQIYEEYEYENIPEREPGSQNYPQNFLNKQQSELEYKLQYSNNHKPTKQPQTTEINKLPETVEYEYYDYDADPSTTTTTTTTSRTTSTSKYSVKYPSLPKDRIKTSSSEKVAVVIPSKDQDFYTENKLQVSTETSVPSTTTTSTIITTTPTEKGTTEKEITNQFKKTTPHVYKPNQVYKEPAPVFEDVKEDYTTRQIITSAKKQITEKPTTPTEATAKPIIITASSKEQESNANIVLVPTKATVKNDTGHKFSQPEFPTEIQKTSQKLFNYDYTTEFTVGVIHGENGVAHGPGKTQSGHFVASSISTNPYSDDEPFRPIPKPPGMTSNFQLVHEENQRQPTKNSPVFNTNRQTFTPPPLEETEPIHEPHEFIPSPQFHRPPETKPPVSIRPGSDVDYDFEGIQTEPKPGQYVIFSKPQLNPEMNVNQPKKKPEISSPTKTVSNVPHYHEKINPYWQESQKHVVFNPSEGQIYQPVGKPKPSPDGAGDQDVPVYGSLPNNDHPPLQLVPPKGTQSENPFEGNFVSLEEKQESNVNYPRPHWEKNTKPSFLMNTLSNKNDMVGSRHPPVPPQMSPTLIPPSNIPPQRFRRPVQPHGPPMRKNFNEAGPNVKSNLPNILPQFRPNTKVGSGPYHRPPGYHSNRRNGLNRYHEKEHGNFPYHIQHPDRDLPVHKEYEMESEIIPKFITTRGKLPSDMWGSQGVQKRFGQGPRNVHSDEKILRRHQRTPVTTLQMLKQRPGVIMQKTQVSREDSVDSSASLLPPIYKTYVDEPKNKENVYIVYPARAPQKLHSDDTKVFIVSDTKSKKNYFNLTQIENQQPLGNVHKKGNSNEKPKNSFPYGFVKPVERVTIKRKDQRENEENIHKNIKMDEIENEQMTQEKQKIIPTAVPEKDEKIDMMLHMQSNNQWNEVKTLPDSTISVQNPAKIIRNDYYRFSDQTGNNNKIQLNPPSEFHTSIKDDSAFTLGAVMHTMSEGSRKGQVANIPLHNDDEVSLPKLNVNERISNGKIVTVSMPLDVKQDPNGKETQYQFQAPFQPSSSLTSNESHPVSQGWSIVKSPEDESNAKEENETTETSSNATFNFENFKPELLGGFKPIFELPDEPVMSKKEEKTTNGKQSDGAR